MREASFPPDEVLRDIRHIYITGSGDCNAGGAICKPVVEKLLGGFSAKVYVDTPLHVGRYLSLVASDDNPAVAAQTLLIGLSVWGFPARVVECLRRAEKLGVHTLDITNNVDSPVAEASEYLLDVHVPETPDTHPGCRDYFGTLVGTVLTAAYIGEVKGLQPAGTLDRLADEIIRMADEYAARMEALDDAMFRLAEEVRDKVDRFEGVGDGYEYASAFFFPAKIIETVGNYATWTDSIHFRKNSLYYREPGRIFTAFYGEVDAANRTASPRRRSWPRRPAGRCCSWATRRARRLGCRRRCARWSCPKRPPSGRSWRPSSTTCPPTCSAPTCARCGAATISATAPAALSPPGRSPRSGASRA